MSVLNNYFKARINQQTQIALKLEAVEKDVPISHLAKPLFRKVLKKHSKMIEELRSKAENNNTSVEEELILHLKKMGATPQLLQKKLKKSK